MIPAAGAWPTPHCAAAEAYVDDVLAGRVAAGRFEVLACRRHRADMARAEAGDGRWLFDPYAGERACAFVETLRHIKGEWARRRERIRLAGWQSFVVVSIFGWLDRETGARRFRDVYLEVARKNAKSTLLAGVGLYLAFIEGEPGAEVLAAATTRDQALKVWGDARAMAQRSAEVRGTAGVLVQAKALRQPSTESVFLPVAGQTDALDGWNVHAALVDELHAHPNRKVIDTLRSGMGAREQPLAVSITTAGAATAGPCWDERIYLCKVLDGLLDGERLFGVVYAIDDEDDAFDPAVWRKANPNLGVSVSEDYLAGEAEAARNNPARRGEFLRKHVCRWSGAGVGAFDVEAWRAGADPSVTAAALAGLDRVVLGVDGSKTSDFTALAAVGYRGREALCLFEVHAPGDVLDAVGGEHLAAWCDAGLIVRHDGAMIDTSRVREAVEAMVRATGAAEVAFDALYLSHAMAEAAKALPGVDWVEQPQRPFALDPAFRTLQGLVAERRTRHAPSAVVDWAFGNARAKQAGDALRLVKDHPMSKIDPVQALVTALARLEAPADAPALTEEMILARGGLL